jgi:trans-aconitate 2-methyltransferase
VYYELLEPKASDLDIWTTEYLQVLQGEDPVLGWMRGTALTPYLAALPQEQKSSFEVALAEQLRKAYPRLSGGETLFPFKRLFMVATRR